MNNVLTKPVQPDDIEALLTAMFVDRAGPGVDGLARPSNSTPTTPMPNAIATSAAAAPATQQSGPAERRRFRTSDVAAHLDMAVIGDVCVGVTLAGYQSVLTGFLDDEGGSAANLLAALERADTAALKTLAHAVKGASASMGLRAINSLTLRIESEGAGFDAATCATSAAQLRELMATARALLQRMGFIRATP
jgi:hypothetical protein